MIYSIEKIAKILNGKVLGYNVKFDDIIPFYDDDVEELNDKELDA